MFEQLVDRQINEIAVALGIDDHLLARLEYRLDGLDVQALARDCRCSFVLGEQLQKALSITFRFGDFRRAIRLRILDPPDGLAARARNAIVRIRLRFARQPIAVFARTNRIFLRRLHFRRHFDVLKIDGRDFDAGLVCIERSLDEFLRPLDDFLSTRLENIVERAAPDHFANRALANFFQRVIGLEYVECVVEWIGATELNF